MKSMNRGWMVCLALGLSLLLGGSRAMAQQDSLAQYFDDNGMSTRKNIISTNFLAPVSGVLGLRYERAIGKRVGLEIGAYKLMPFYIFELLLPIDAYLRDFDPKGGFGLSGATHFYFSGKAPEFHWIGPRYGFRRYSMQDGGSLTVHDITIDYGYNLFISKYFMFCYDVGMGYRRMSHHGFSNWSGMPYREEMGSLYMFWSLGLGVIF